jgi:hypothetical protein
MPKALDLAGQKFGRLTVIGRGERTEKHRTTWICRCECGKNATVQTGNLTSGNTTSCGCINDAVDLTGQRFGRWTVIERSGTNQFKSIMWLCRCDCGKQSRVIGYMLKSGKTQSCGCAHHEETQKRATTHGKWGTSEYQSWHAMLQRCGNSKHKNYKYYGGRGIKVCERWLKFENFFADMGKKPTPKHSIERNETNDGYNPENCRWATTVEQNNNTRRNIKNKEKYNAV